MSKTEVKVERLVSWDKNPTKKPFVKVTKEREEAEEVEQEKKQQIKEELKEEVSQEVEEEVNLYVQEEVDKRVGEGEKALQEEFAGLQRAFKEGCLEKLAEQLEKHGELAVGDFITDVYGEDRVFGYSGNLGQS